MKNIFLLIGIILVQHVGIILAQDSPYIADFYNNKAAAITITFDDATYGQYEYAFPTLKKYKFNATFGFTGEWFCEIPTKFSEDGHISYVRMSKHNLLRLWLSGNEISWHGLKHEMYNESYSWNKLHRQMQSEISIANNLLDGIPINSIFYPYSATKGKVSLAAESSDFLFGRTGGQDYNVPSDIDWYLLKSFAITNDSIPNKIEFENIIQNSIGKWCILMYHHIILDDSEQRLHYNRHNIKNSYAISPETFDVQMSIISNTDFWVGTIFDIGRYLKQKQNSKLIVENVESGIYITILCNLDKEIYDHEMTVIYNNRIYNIVPNTKIKIN